MENESSFRKETEGGFRSDLKILVIGNSNSNKNSFVNKWTKNIFSETYKSTIVSEFGFKIYEYEGKLYRIQLWDLAGTDKNTLALKMFAKDSHGIIFMRDPTNINAREYTIKWKESVNEFATFIDDRNLTSILVENNIDLLDNQEEDDPTFNEFWKENDFTGGFKVSSKTGKNVNESMDFLIQNIIYRMEAFNTIINDKKIVFETKKMNLRNYKLILNKYNKY